MLKTGTSSNESKVEKQEITWLKEWIHSFAIPIIDRSLGALFK
jgi:hypothetical protein